MPKADKRIRVMAADDHPLLREGIAAVIREQEDMVVVAEAASGREAIEGFRDHRPDILLMDLQMPDLDGVEAIAAIRQEFPQARIIVLTTYSGDVRALRAIKAGALGYLLKGMIRRELLDTIRSVHTGLKRIPAEIALEIAEYVSQDELTDREMDALKQVATGKANNEIGVQLGVSEETVKSTCGTFLRNSAPMIEPTLR